MAKQVTFKVSKPSAGLKTECVWMQPESVEDPRWNEIAVNPSEDINELAVQNMIIKIQSGARDALEEGGAEAAQKYVDEYKYGARTGGGFRRPTVEAGKARDLNFTPEQIEALKAIGVKFTTEEEEQAQMAAAAEAEKAEAAGEAETATA